MPEGYYHREIPVLRQALGVLLLLAVVVVCYAAAAWFGWMGRSQHAGDVSEAKIPAAVVERRAEARARAAQSLGEASEKQILFGDLHVHTTFSSDAFLWSLPLMQGEGAHPPADACDFARYCSAIDFWSINDHAESLTPRRWNETKDTMRRCEAVGRGDDGPDVVVFTGWEWTQVGNAPTAHYGHKNVIFRDTAEDRLPVRPIAAGGPNLDAFRSTMDGVARLVLPAVDLANRQRAFDFDLFQRETAAVPLCESGVDVRDLPAECAEIADTPRILFDKLDQWGFDSIVIPHGTSWGATAPRGASWDAQRDSGFHDSGRQVLIEVYSGHGNSEEYRGWSGLSDAAGNATCPTPTREYEPNCWRAGEIIRRRCLEAGSGRDECDRRAELARQHHVDAGKNGVKVIPGQRDEEWLDAGQCRDCFLPAYNYRPGMSVQAALARRRPDGSGFNFGLIASSDNHSARPGAGYKENGRVGMTESRGIANPQLAKLAGPGEATAASIPPEEIPPGLPSAERQASFWLTGGLVAVHAEARDRDSIWRALQRREVYGTSGPRILLWFDLLREGAEIAMGGTASLGGRPTFRVRALGSLKQKPGCPDYATRALGADRVRSLCKGECYHPSDQRHLITRVEVVRIRPQLSDDEPLSQLIEDPWRSIACGADTNGCNVEFSDPEYETAGRDAVYYVRAIQEATPAVNGGGLRCDRDAAGRCLRTRPCFGGHRTLLSDDCLEDVEERAWSSPIFLRFAPDSPGVNG